MSPISLTALFLLLVHFAWVDGSCDCNYNWTPLSAVGGGSGCRISRSPPPGYKCRCIYSFLWKCRGVDVPCPGGDCKCTDDRSCCLGDCNGYQGQGVNVSVGK